MDASQWSDMLKEGGMSAPAWAFFSAITLALIALLREVVIARHKVDKVAETAQKAVDNTNNVANGYVRKQQSNFDTLFEMFADMDRKFDRLGDKVDDHIEQSNDILRLNPDIKTRKEN